MKNFTYRSLDERENIEEILKRRRRKINRQQIISIVIFVALIGSVALYVGHHLYYTVLDGYVSVDTNRVRTPFDIYLDSVYVKTGDLVVPGDTLYSYYMLNMLVDNANPDEEPPMVAVSRNYKLQYETARQQIEVLKVRIAELKKQIQREDHDIALGLSSNSHKLDLERELKEAEARLRALQAELATLRRTRDETKVVFDRQRRHLSDNSLIPQIYDDARAASMRRAVSYRLASDSSLITDVKAPTHMVFFKEEEILSKQHLNLEANNLKVVAYVPVAKMSKITNNSRADIVVNDEVSYKAHVSVLGTRTEMIPENLRSYFEKKNTAVIALLDIDPGQTLPLWSLASGMPVEVRVKNWRFFKDEEDSIKKKPDYLWFTTGSGVMTEEKDGHLVPINDSVALRMSEAEKAKAEAAKAEKERAEKVREARKAEEQRQAREEKAMKEKAAKEKAEREKARKAREEKAAKEKAAKEKAAKEKAAKEKAAKEKARKAQEAKKAK